MVAKYYREQGLCVYDPAVTDKFLQKLEDRYASGEVSYNYLRQIRQITRRLNEFYLTGTLRIDATQHGTKYVLSSHSERLVDLFVAHQEYGQIRGMTPCGRSASIFAILKGLGMKHWRL